MTRESVCQPMHICAQLVPSFSTLVSSTWSTACSSNRENYVLGVPKCANRRSTATPARLRSKQALRDFGKAVPPKSHEVLLVKQTSSASSPPSCGSCLVGHTGFPAFPGMHERKWAERGRCQKASIGSWRVDSASRPSPIRRLRAQAAGPSGSGCVFGAGNTRCEKVTFSQEYH